MICFRKRKQSYLWGGLRTACKTYGYGKQTGGKAFQQAVV
jgi:hypothetical protein